MISIDHNMNRKKMRLLTHKSSKAKSAKAGRRVWVILIFALILIAIGYVMWAKPEPNTVLPLDTSPTMAEQTEAAQVASTSEDIVFDDTDTMLSDSTVVDETRDIDNGNRPKAPSPKAILEAPLPETDSLAKEEIDRLEDERKRLAEQEKLAAEQLAMNKKLTDMKAEQIALLEQQIAQLEADGAAQVQ